MEQFFGGPPRNKEDEKSAGGSSSPKKPMRNGDIVFIDGQPPIPEKPRNEIVKAALDSARKVNGESHTAKPPVAFPPAAEVAAVSPREAVVTVPQETSSNSSRVEPVVDIPLEKGDVFENPEGKRFVVGLADKDKVVYEEQIAKDVPLKRKTYLSRTPLENFRVKAGVAEMKKVDRLQETHPVFYEFLIEELRKTDAEYTREFNSYVDLFEEFDQREKKTGAKKIEEVKSLVAGIDENWTALGDITSYAVAEQKFKLLLELKSLVALLPDKKLIKRKKELLEAIEAADAVADEDKPAIAEVRKQHEKIVYEGTVKKLNEVADRLQKKYDHALVGRGVSFAGSALPGIEFEERSNTLVDSITEQSSAEETEKVFAELSDLEKQMFIEEDEYDNGNGKKGRKGKKIKRIREGKYDKEEGTHRAQEEVSPESLWGYIESLQSGLLEAAKRIKDPAERTRQLEDINNQIAQAKEYFDVLTKERTQGDKRDPEKIELLRKCKARLTRMYLSLRVDDPEEKSSALIEFEARAEYLWVEIAGRIQEADTLEKLEKIGTPETRKDAESGREYTVREFVKETDIDLKEVTDQLIKSSPKAATSAAIYLKGVNAKLLALWEKQARTIKKKTHAEKPKSLRTPDSVPFREALEMFKQQVEISKQQILLQIAGADSPQALERIGKKKGRYDRKNREVHFVQEFLKETDEQLTELAEKIRGKSRVQAAELLKKVNEELWNAWRLRRDSLASQDRTRSMAGKSGETLLPGDESLASVGSIETDQKGSAGNGETENGFENIGWLDAEKALIEAEISKLTLATLPEFSEWHPADKNGIRQYISKEKFHNTHEYKSLTKKFEQRKADDRLDKMNYDIEFLYLGKCFELQSHEAETRFQSLMRTADDIGQMMMIGYEPSEKNARRARKTTRGRIFIPDTIDDLIHQQETWATLDVQKAFQAMIDWNRRGTKLQKEKFNFEENFEEQLRKKIIMPINAALSKIWEATAHDMPVAEQFDSRAERQAKYEAMVTDLQGKVALLIPQALASVERTLKDEESMSLVVLVRENPKRAKERLEYIRGKIIKQIEDKSEKLGFTPAEKERAKKEILGFGNKQLKLELNKIAGLLEFKG